MYSGGADGGEDVASVIFDVGTCSVKCGFAGEDTPKTVYPTDVGVLIGQESNGDAMAVDARKYFVGSNSYSLYREGMEIRNATRDGVIVDWDIVEQLWEHGLRDRLRVDSKEHPLLLCEPVTMDKAARERVTQLAFERFEVPAFFVSKAPVLATFATGRDRGVVLDSGGGSTSATCVHDGYALLKTVTVLPLGGEALTRSVEQLLAQRDVVVRPRYQIQKVETAPGRFRVDELTRPATASYHAAMVRAVARDLKESVCRVSDETWSNVANDNVQSAKYELPDGKVLELKAERFEIAEPLFAPLALRQADDNNVAARAAAASAVGNTLQAAALRSVFKADVDVQREMFANLIVTGGNSLLPGFSERLVTELTDVCAEQMFKLKLVAHGFASERRYAPWVGGSILASLGTFQQMWISKSEYEEFGAPVVHKKCP